MEVGEQGSGRQHRGRMTVITELLSSPRLEGALSKIDPEVSGFITRKRKKTQMHHTLLLSK